MQNTNENISLEESTDATISKNQPEKVAPLPGMIALGSAVKINKTTMTGIVDEYHLSRDKKIFSYLVSFKDDEGENHQRSFLHNQITVITEE
jgi:hypothetical protein